MRILLLLITLTVVPALAHAQAPTAARKSPVTTSGQIAWSNDMTYENSTMTGGTIEIGLPIGIGQWVVVEAGYLQSRYPHPVFEPSHVRRAVLLVGARLGSANRHGVFAQFTAGGWLQEFDPEGIGGSRETGKFESDDLVFTVGPGVGLDVPLGRRLSLSGVLEVHLMPQRPRDRWVVVKVTAGATYRFGR